MPTKHARKWRYQSRVGMLARSNPSEMGFVILATAYPVKADPGLE